MGMVAFSFFALNFYNSFISMLHHMTPLFSVPERVIDRTDTCNMRALSPAIALLNPKCLLSFRNVIPTLEIQTSHTQRYHQDQRI